MNTLETYQALLTRYLDDEGGVRYQAWNESPSDVAALDQVLGAWQAKSPQSDPENFSSASHRLGYWLNLYNALVIREILRHWPLESVRDVRPTLMSKVAPLKGFFKDLHFVVGGEKMNLSEIENEVIRSQFRDARIHFALNCGSAACPILRRSVFDGSSLEEQLREASVAFISDEAHVRVDDDAKTLWLSKLFKWYASDFERHAQLERDGKESTVVDFLALFASPALRTKLQRASSQNYRIRYDDYDWSLNAAGSGDAVPGDAVPGDAVPGDVAL